MSHRTKARLLLLFFIVLCMINIAIWIVRVPENRALLSLNYWQNLLKVGEVMRVVEANYVDADKVEFEKLRSTAIERMTSELDVYSGFMNKSGFTDFEMETNQQYVGIGVQIMQVDERITIMRVFADSPAEGAGLRSGDQIVAVGNENTEAISTRDIIKLLKGAPGTSTSLTIYRPSEERHFDTQIERNEINWPSIIDTRLSTDAIGYIHLIQFGAKTQDEFEQVLTDLEGAGMQALILDLRGNPGGLLTAAVEVAGQFLPKGTLITYTDGRAHGTRNEYRTTNQERIGHYPVAVLIDHYSASASEIVSGALQDLGRAIIVGETSVGKGSVQSIIPISNGEAVKLTTARYYLPSGRTIVDVGVQPDIVVELDEDTLEKLQTQNTHLGTMTDEAFTERFGYEPINDAVEEAAREALLEQLDP